MRRWRYHINNRLLIDIKNIFIFILIGICILIILPCLILRQGTKINTKYVVPKFGMNSGNIIFNTKLEKQPIIKVYISSQKKIKEINLENYVRGVVAAEMPAAFDSEAIKAQAVAARTYALSHIENFGGSKCNEAKGADVCDTVHCQVYMSKEDRIKLWPKSEGENYWNKITKAINETAGQVIMYKGEMIKAPYYFSTSSGKTENCIDVFSVDLPYLKSVDSSGEEASPKFTSSVKLTNSELIKKINSSYPKAGLSSKNIKSQLYIKSRTDAGSVKEIKVSSMTISGSAFRNVIGLNSNNFDIKYSLTGVEIICKGNGHDVGMSQWGAYSMAKSGKNYKEILTHYYTNTTIENINGAEWTATN